MLETRAIVVLVQGNEALVEASGGGGCGHCSSEGGCGSGKLTKLFCSNPRQFKVLNEANAGVGDEVQIILQDGVLLRSSMLIYALPLVLLIIGGIAGSYWSNDTANRDGLASIGSLLGLFAGFVLAKWIARRHPVMAIARPLGTVAPD